ncbi:hypothetical protein HH310_09190 [Actinoplanes sp. TBRC 11911]|uniref:hypothetical protein n=1 Tax=Actinoplanes sp. TBRC 11911 TaxID=2729386 RepID=UPI00145E1966|nr:hypothetical protein [Actinoplanes sp. TBRC 11911]NMO51362.1 hypothetical protein [Actinoplanes sp. TBRC 11911]
MIEDRQPRRGFRDNASEYQPSDDGDPERAWPTAGHRPPGYGGQDAPDGYAYEQQSGADELPRRAAAHADGDRDDADDLQYGPPSDRYSVLAELAYHPDERDRGDGDHAAPPSGADQEDFGHPYRERAEAPLPEGSEHPYRAGAEEPRPEDYGHPYREAPTLRSEVPPERFEAPRFEPAPPERFEAPRFEAAPQERFEAPRFETAPPPERFEEPQLERFEEPQREPFGGPQGGEQRGERFDEAYREGFETPQPGGPYADADAPYRRGYGQDEQPTAVYGNGYEDQHDEQGGVPWGPPPLPSGPAEAAPATDVIDLTAPRVLPRTHRGEQRKRALVLAVAAAGVLLAGGVGYAIFGTGSSDPAVPAGAAPAEESSTEDPQFPESTDAPTEAAPPPVPSTSASGPATVTPSSRTTTRNPSNPRPTTARPTSTATIKFPPVTKTPTKKPTTKPPTVAPPPPSTTPSATPSTSPSDTPSTGS